MDVIGYIRDDLQQQQQQQQQQTGKCSSGPKMQNGPFLFKQGQGQDLLDPYWTVCQSVPWQIGIAQIHKYRND